MTRETKTVSPRKADPTELSDERVLEMYRAMWMTRALDERALRLQRQGRIGFYVPAEGQEASHVGTAAALGADDWVFPSYRDPGIALLRGIPVVELLHQCYGNSADNTKGRQMPVHYSFARIHFASISSPIGTQIVQAAGVAMAAKIRKDPIVVMTYFGDGATSSNDFHTGMNFAGVYAAPCVFVCENNGWAISCPIEGQTASNSFAIKADAYGMPGVRVDGNDLFAVYRATKEAVERARSGGGPTLIEAVTFRIGAHSSSDDAGKYRRGELVDEWRRKDPIARVRTRIVEQGIWDEDKETALRDEIQAELQAAVEAAESVGPPGLRSVVEDVFAEPIPALEEQWEDLRRAYESGVHSGRQHGEFPL